MTPSGAELRRTLGVGDAVVIGPGSMIGAGMAPAARVVPAVGLLGCVVLAYALPGVSVVVGAGVLGVGVGVGVVAYVVRRRLAGRKGQPG